MASALTASASDISFTTVGGGIILDTTPNSIPVSILHSTESVVSLRGGMPITTSDAILAVESPVVSLSLPPLTVQEEMSDVEAQMQAAGLAQRDTGMQYINTVLAALQAILPSSSTFPIVSSGTNSGIVVTITSQDPPPIGVIPTAAELGSSDTITAGPGTRPTRWKLYKRLIFVSMSIITIILGALQLWRA